MTGSDIERLNDLRRLYDRFLDKFADITNPQQKARKALKLMDKLLGPEWRSEVKSKPEFEVFEIEIIADGPPVKNPEKFYDRVRQLLLDNGLDSKDYINLAPSVQDDQECDCYECTPCDCPACKPCDCLMCRVEHLEQLVQH